MRRRPSDMPRRRVLVLPHFVLEVGFPDILRVLQASRHGFGYLCGRVSHQCARVSDACEVKPRLRDRKLLAS
jgi:hypothetical protein